MDQPLSAVLPQPTQHAVFAALKSAFEANHPVRLTSTSLVFINKLPGASSDNDNDDVDSEILDSPFLTAIWEHARRRAEDQAVLVLSNSSAPPLSTLQHLLPAFPNIPGHVFSALTALAPFLNVGRVNTAVSVELSLSLSGQVLASRIRVSDDKADPSAVRSAIAASPVFTYLLETATDTERDALSLRSNFNDYALIRHTVLPESLKRKAADWRQALLECSLSGTSALRGIFQVLSGILLFSNSDEDDILDGATLLGLDPDKLDSEAIMSDPDKRFEIVLPAYRSLLLIMVAALNNYLATIDVIAGALDSDEVCSVVSIVDMPAAFKAAALKPIFSSDHTPGSIASEMIQDGIAISPTPAWINQTLQQQEPANPLVDIANNNINISAVVEPNALLSTIPSSSSFGVASLISSARVWHIISIASSDSFSEAPVASPGNAALAPWSNTVVSSQVRAWFMPNWLQKYKTIDFTADFGVDEFLDRYAPLLQSSGIDPSHPYALDTWAQTQREWGADGFFHGHQRIWLREDVWRTLEGELDGLLLMQQQQQQQQAQNLAPVESEYGMFIPDRVGTPASRERLLTMSGDELRGSDDEDLTMFGSKFAANDPEAHGRVIEVRPKTRTRKIWTAITWLLTFWIPSFCLSWVGRMKRPDVRMAWREKVAICILIFFLNAALIFYMVGLRLILCPDYDDAYSAEEVSYHTTSNDFYVSIHGKVYDISKFWKLQHSDNGVDTTSSTMEVFAGLDLSNYFPPPLTVVCPDLVTDESIYLSDNTTVTYSTAVHWSGPELQSDKDSALYDISWYKSTFLPKIKQYYKGDLVVKKSTVESYGENGYDNWAIIDGKIYDLTNYFYTIDLYPSSSSDSYAVYDFLDSDVKQLFSDYPGQDITDYFYDTSTISASTAAKNLKCLNGAFYAGKVDFRDSARCTVSNYILLAMAGVLCFVILFKFVMSLQFGSKPMPTMQDKFVICQIPAYTEGEDELRRAIDSLTALQYDNKRKLLFIICDGMIIGSGNEKPTPNIVLELLGADPRLDPPALPFRSVGEGSAQLNYGKVYSGLYEFEGNVVPYVVVVKVGKPTEKSRPGNRGKRDSQILLMDFLNKVHFQAAMSPLQLEIFHQINNVIGVDPELYEYVLMVDADTSVMPDSLNRLVAKCVQDSRIAGIAGETSLTNQEKSWWTMIQVFEYYISHHLSKSFESLFGSVTCLPGCFSMYRLRTADKAKPLIIANAVLEAYSDGDVNTLHKKNLLSLGEDRFLTTLMTKHFPRMRYVFAYDAHAETDAPASWSVLLSQRRRWINSTIHNLAELAFLPDLCGFCLFSMRFVIVMDLFGTLMLPSVMVYMVYIIYKAVVDPTNFPLISVCMIAAIYGIQALVFLLRRQWQQIGWMVIYLLAYPIYSFVLPVYSFWNQDNFSWGNTRIVVGERGNKEIIAINDEGFDERSIPLQTWEEYATHNNLPGRVRPHIIPSVGSEKAPGVMYTSEIMKEESYEMEDMRSVYSSYPPPAMSVYSGVQNTPHPPSQYGGRPGSVAYGYSAPSPGAYAPHPGYAAPQYAPSVAPSAYNMGTQYQQRPQHMSGMTLYQQQNVLLDQQRQAGYDGRSTPYGR